MKPKLPFFEILGAAIIGVVSGFYIFQPPLEQLRNERLKQQQQSNQSNPPITTSSISSSEGNTKPTNKSSL